MSPFIERHMRIYVDADGLPKSAKEIIIRTAVRMRVPVVFVANKPIRYDHFELLSSLIVPEGPDIADDRIAELTAPGDLVITADIPLAARVITKGASALDPRGKLYTEENINDRLAMRDLLSKLRDVGLMTGGPPPFGRKDRQSFADQLDRFLISSLRNLRESR
jgi:uncharacterized protein YaiI (UPF0178 family)